MSDQVSKPTLYVEIPFGGELKHVVEASRSDVLEALGLDYEAAARAIRANPSQLAQAHIGTVSYQMARHIVDAALGLEEDE